MTRRFVDDIRSEITTLMADNSIGAITEAIQRGVLTDMCDSLIQDECAMNIDVVKTSVPVPTTWTVISAQYDSVTGGDGVFLIPNLGAGQVQTSAVAGYTYEVIGAYTIEGDNNAEFEFAVSVDGVPGILLSGVTTGGAGRPVSVFVRGYLPSTPASANIGISFRAYDAGRSIDLVDGAFGVIILPTNNP